MIGTSDELLRALTLARIALAFGRVERATRHEDGLRPETDTDHTVMLGLVACELAPFELDQTKVAAFSLVHDLVEVYAGDAQTLVISADERAAKKAREEAAQARLTRELGPGSWIAGLLATYEAQQEPEARFVRLVDKILPKLTHAFNGCVAAQPITNHAGFVDAHARQFRQLREEYPEFPDTLALLLSSMMHAEERWWSEPAPAAPVAAPARRSLPASLSAPVEPVTFPAAAVTDDVAALSAAGFRVWSIPPHQLARACTDGWSRLVERAGYDVSRAFERWYTNGHLVVACADRVPGAPDLTAGEAEEGGEP